MITGAFRLHGKELVHVFDTPTSTSVRNSDGVQKTL